MHLSFRDFKDPTKDQEKLSKATVFLNGIERLNCLIVDTDAGYLIRTVILPKSRIPTVMIEMGKVEVFFLETQRDQHKTKGR